MSKENNTYHKLHEETRALVALILGWAVFIAPTCRLREHQCSSDSDCAPGLTCIRWKWGFGPIAITTCARTCQTNGDCPAGQSCMTIIEDGPRVPTCAEIVTRTERNDDDGRR